MPDWEGLGGNPKIGCMETLLALLRSYASNKFSYRSLAEALNSQEYRNREGNPFTKGSVEHVLYNRFYEGKVVYHLGNPMTRCGMGCTRCLKKSRNCGGNARR